ncbi:hypothetical protein HDE_08421 [Halotydeus destructor]|nr:hypothetical protein HDE_08421 [Halotydeus destructor]
MDGKLSLVLLYLLANAWSTTAMDMDMLATIFDLVGTLLNLVDGLKGGESTEGATASMGRSVCEPDAPENSGDKCRYTSENANCGTLENCGLCAVDKPHSQDTALKEQNNEYCRSMCLSSKNKYYKDGEFLHNYNSRRQQT